MKNQTKPIKPTIKGYYWLNTEKCGTFIILYDEHIKMIGDNTKYDWDHMVDKFKVLSTKYVGRPSQYSNYHYKEGQNVTLKDGRKGTIINIKNSIWDLKGRLNILTTINNSDHKINISVYPDDLQYK